MTQAEVGAYEKREICDQVDRILRDLGNPEPPLRLKDVRALLKLDLHYYNRSDPSIISELTHRFTLLAKKTIPDIGKHLLTALSKSRLCAFWVPDSQRILVDKDVPEPKHRWIEGHEISHSITPWHREFLLGDNSHTLDPMCHAILEAEANYGAGRLLFLQNQFAREARALDLSFKSIKFLAKRYDNSIMSTLWRTVEDRDPNQAVFGMISIHPHHPDIGVHDESSPWRYFIRSVAFRTQFSTVSPDKAFKLIASYASSRRTGPVMSVHHILQDIVGDEWVFQIESFSNSYALLTFGVAVRKCSHLVQVGQIQ